MQRPESQSRSPLQALSVAQGVGQLSPQSAAGSRPLRTPSVQLSARGTSQVLTSSEEQAGTHSPSTHASLPEQSSAETQQPSGLAQPEEGAPAEPASAVPALPLP